MGQIASRAQLRMSLLRWVLVFVPLVVLLGLASSRLAGSGEESPWFTALRKPAIMPPGALFPIAWSLLYVLMGVALAIVFNARGSRVRGAAIGLFVVQLALNLAWSPLFFAMHEVTVAAWWIVVLLLAAAATAWAFVRVRPVAGALLLPYLAWLAFATVLTFQIDRLNPDAERLAPEGASTQVAL